MQYFSYPSSYHLRENIVRSIGTSERDGRRRATKLQGIGLHKMIEKRLFQEYAIPLETRTVLCSEWLSSDKIIMGTKCSRLVIYDVMEDNCAYVKPLGTNSVSGFDCSINAVSSNPSKTLVASGGTLFSDILVYFMPSFQCVCLGKKVHVGSVFDLKWIDDENVISAAGDGALALWHINEKDTPRHAADSLLMDPVIVKPCKLASEISSINIQRDYSLVALSANRYLHHWDINKFQQISSHKLPYFNDVVCLAYNENYNLYAVGSQSHITFVDGHNLAIIKNVRTRSEGDICLSMGFKENTLSVGTGFGSIHFFDIISGRFYEDSMQSACSGSDAVQQFSQNDDQLSDVTDSDHNAIYTHCFDSSGTRLFTGGTTWSSGEQGNYAALWQ